MARKKTKVEKTPLLEKNKDLKKISLFITIVPRSQGNNIVKLLQTLGSSMQIIQKGRGTAVKQTLDILGIEDNRKDVVFAFVTNDKIPDIKTELEAYFASHKSQKGIGFAIGLTSIIGARIYHFLANDL